MDHIKARDVPSKTIFNWDWRFRFCRNGASKAISEKAVKLGARAFINNPYKLQDRLNVVRQALG